MDGLKGYFNKKFTECTRESKGLSSERSILRTQPIRAKSKVLEGLKGRKLGGALNELYASDPIADAFYTRKWLVQLQYAQKTVVVAISSVEASNERQAVEVADKRAQRAAWLTSNGGIGRGVWKTISYGNLVRSRVLPDCSEAREQLGVSGPAEAEYSHTNFRPL